MDDTWILVMTGNRYSATDFYELRELALKGDKEAGEECVARIQRSLGEVNDKTERLLLSWSRTPTERQIREWQELMRSGRREEKSLMSVKDVFEPGFSDRYEKKYPPIDAYYLLGGGLWVPDAYNGDEILDKDPGFYRKMERMLPVWDSAQRRWVFPRYWDKAVMDAAGSAKS